MTLAQGVFGQQQANIPGRAKRAVVTDDTVHGVGTTRIGQRCHLKIVKATEGDPEVFVRVCGGVGNNPKIGNLGDGGTVISNLSPPLEIYNPNAGVMVTVQKQYTGGSDFTAYLYSVDGSGEITEFPPVLVSSGQQYHAASTGLNLPVPGDSQRYDLLLAWIITEVNTFSPTPPVDAGEPWFSVGKILPSAAMSVSLWGRYIGTADPEPESYQFTGPDLVNRKWAGVILRFRVEGANSISDYGFLGLPQAFGCVTSGTTGNSPQWGVFPPMPSAQLTADDRLAVSRTPMLQMACFAVNNGSVPGAGVIPGVFNLCSQQPLTEGFLGTDATGNAMIAVAVSLVGQVRCQWSAYQMSGSSQFDWQGATYTLGKLF